MFECFGDLQRWEFNNGVVFRDLSPVRGNLGPTLSAEMVFLKVFTNFSSCTVRFRAAILSLEWPNRKPNGKLQRSSHISSLLLSRLKDTVLSAPTGCHTMPRL